MDVVSISWSIFVLSSFGLLVEGKFSWASAKNFWKNCTFDLRDNFEAAMHFESAPSLGANP